MTTLCWLKAPLQAPDLPRKQILADCYAAMQPGDELWSRYLNEVDRLKEAGDVTQEDYDTLRYSIDARRALMNQTLGSSESFTLGTVAEVLKDHARQVHEGQALEELRRVRAGADQEAARADSLEGKLRTASERLAAQGQQAGEDPH